MFNRRTLLTLFTVCALSGCLEGGANQGGRQPGNTEGGIDLGLGEIAVGGDGRYFVSVSNGHLVVGDLEQRSMRSIEGLPPATLLGFWESESSAGFYMISHELWSESLEERVLSYDLGEDQIVWARNLRRLDFALDVAPGGQVVVWGGAGYAVLDPGTGQTITEVDMATGMTDLDLLSDGRMIVTHQTRRDADRLPFTDISVHTIEGGERSRTTAPNCDSELVVDPTETRAFLAPTRCGRDPVSVIELDGASCRFDRNLPGFGPVAPSPDGATMVAFMDRDIEDPTAPPTPDEVKNSEHRFHLMFIDVETLAFETTPVGDLLPRYTFTPDGRTLLVDHSDAIASEGVVLLDVAEHTLRRARGPVVDLDEYVLTPDSTRAFIVDAGLYELDLADALVSSIPLDFIPMSINMTPAGESLLLKDRLQEQIFIFDVGARKVDGEPLHL